LSFGTNSTANIGGVRKYATIMYNGTIFRTNEDRYMNQKFKCGFLECD